MLVDHDGKWLLALGEGLAGFAATDRAELLSSLAVNADRELDRIAADAPLVWRVLGVDES
ncbi:MAG: hypothetical protein JST31_00695 [Actinobacteria bacterium]|nr:hypothetical protein [Actinomycetota bacterium]